MQKATWTFAVLASVLVLGTSAHAQSYMGAIDGTQEVPANSSTATGFGCFELVGTTFSFDISFSGLSAAETAAHVHGPAPAGSNAGVQFALPAGDPKVGSVTITAAQIADLNAGLWYVNIHSANFPGGEIRGQIMPGACPLSVESGTWGRIKSLYTR